MPRFFVPKDQIPVISGSDAHQIRDVLRMKAGDQLELLDGSGTIHQARIADLKKDKIRCEIISTQSIKAESKIKVTLAQCLPKAKKMDLIIQKCTELGVHKIIPVLSERSVAKAEKLERWRRIAKEAAEQCGRSDIPQISPLTTFEDVLKQKKDYDLALIPWELEKESSLKKILTTYPANNLTILVLIGPEGGFSKKEVDLATDAGFKPVSLGKRILRAETAGMAMLAMIDYAFS